MSPRSKPSSSFHRIAIGSCSHPSLDQPLWPIIQSRHPAAFVWAGDAIYADAFVGFNWSAVGLQRVIDWDSSSSNMNTTNYSKKWSLTFPPPSIHRNGSPDTIRQMYQRQWEIHQYRHFVEGWDQNGNEHVRPFIFGTIDDHDYGANNGDFTYQYKKESNLEFLEFLYFGVSTTENKSCADISHQGNMDFINSSIPDAACIFNREDTADWDSSNKDTRSKKRRGKKDDPLYQRALHGKGVYGVQLFDFSRDVSQNRDMDNILWGGGYWVPEEEALIDPDVISTANDRNTPHQINYSKTHSVAIFVLDVRSNKTPWPSKGKFQKYVTMENISTPAEDVPTHDFLGAEQWKWFRSALSNSHAAINIIVSGLQIHPQRYPNDGNILEEWSKFPDAQQKLYDVILNSEAKSPLLVSGDVHMSQILRKDCIRRSDVHQNISHPIPSKRPLIEVTTSGMTHSWGTSFSSQPKHHKWPLWPYSYFVSRTFMTLAHYIFPWRELVVRMPEDETREKNEFLVQHRSSDEKEVSTRSKIGRQFELGLNFAEFEFDFWDIENEVLSTNHEISVKDNTNIKPAGGAVTVRIFGKHLNHPPKLEMRWTFDELSGNTDLPGMTAKYPHDFKTMEQKHRRSLHNNNLKIEDQWICVPYRGIPSIAHEVVSNTVMFLVFCSLFFLPHLVVVVSIIIAHRRWIGLKRLGQ